MDDPSPIPPKPVAEWKAGLVAELDRVAARDRWGLALMAVGWVHLGFMLICQVMHTSGGRRAVPYVAVWGLELACVLVALRRLAGRAWYRATPLAGLIARVWGTFLILSFNLAALNTLSGLEHEWFKPVLATLSTFGFATMAYLIDTRFFIPAVQMYFTGLLMVMNVDKCYAIYGLSWWVALQGIGLSLERRRAGPQSEPKTRRGAEPRRLAESSRSAIPS